MTGVDKYFPDGTCLFEDVSVGVFYGAKIGVVGVNGSGKSSLLRLMAGFDHEYEGEINIEEGVSIGYLEQEPMLDEAKDVRGNVLDGVSDKLQLVWEFNELTDEQAERRRELQQELSATNAWGIEQRVLRALSALRCPPAEASVDSLSGGERRRVALCRLLVSEPDILVLDEPTNHLDAYSVAWLERYLQQFAGSVIAVTHDRYFLDNIAGWMLEVDRGHLYPHRGNYSSWLSAKQDRLALESRQRTAQERALERELEWMRSPAKARGAKSQARVAQYEKQLAAQRKRPYESGSIVIPPGDRLGRVAVSVRDVSLSIDGRCLLDKVSFDLQAGSLVGIVGPNGAGKSTLLQIIAGDRAPDSGEVVLGDTVQLGHVTQSRADLTPSNSVYEEIAGGRDTLTLGATPDVSMRAFVSAFAFRGDQQQKLVGDLSGGERNRVYLAKMIRDAPNVLLLDEPTNDLDVEVLRSLEMGLDEFAGCAVVVSHDRFFLDRICTHILAFEGDGQVHLHYGNYESYAAERADVLESSEADEHFQLRLL